jgi:chromosome segregation ATPase
MAKLNLQEKRRVEELICSEFNSAINRYRNRRRNERDELEKKLEKNPPAGVRKLREDILKLDSQMHEAQGLVRKLDKQIDDKKDELRQTGFTVVGEKRDIRVIDSYSVEKPSEVSAFNDETEEKVESLEQRRKQYVLMVYGDDAEVKGLFDKVSVELKKLVA